MEREKLRIDKYLWSIRLFKTRALATEACQRGKVKFNGTAIKASRQVSIGDKYEIKTEAKNRVIEVTGLLHNRVDYQTSLQFYLDLTPVQKEANKKPSAFVFFTGKRESKKGRPTKKDKRKLDDLFE